MLRRPGGKGRPHRFWIANDVGDISMEWARYWSLPSKEEVAVMRRGPAGRRTLGAGHDRDEHRAQGEVDER